MKLIKDLKEGDKVIISENNGRIFLIKIKEVHWNLQHDYLVISFIINNEKIYSNSSIGIREKETDFWSYFNTSYSLFSDPSLYFDKRLGDLEICTRISGFSDRLLDSFIEIQNLIKEYETNKRY